MPSAGNILKGLEILSKYVDLNKEYICAEHDEICLPGNPSAVSTEDTKALDALGIFVDEETDSYKCFV